ncbi:stalk domain-containing protein [Paenibacillus lemnae]|uniref:Copper amine oxidase N-terminal domain-containing protein n=1 Tax=Paenibacillus lemnae TaxID=1330551 RepID=A0A848M6A5_PAELE|nr:stalk domain-containing protein [Paenibacillus lemnae]NMO96688.1 copper amine oxidase N-terminal domain-containing protein [Paenibacillus lemnae]
MVKLQHVNVFGGLRRSAAVMITVVLLSTSLSLPVWGDATSKVILTIQQGSKAAAVNGVAYSIAKPVTKQGHLMVPAGIFQKAFGSQIRLEGTDRVVLMHGAHVIVMTIGSKAAWVDGKKVTLPVEPQMISNTLMVPLRPVAKGLGAALGKDKQGRLSITLNVKDKSGDPSDPEAGGEVTSSKSRIGNSYYGWSMDYPSGMVIGGGAENESSASFMDATGQYYLEIYVDSQPETLGLKDLLKQLVRDADDAGELVMHQEIVTRGPYPYARTISRDSEYTLWEGRVYFHGGKRYELYFADRNASHYKDLEKYSGLLNSFKPVFTKGDHLLKDLSSIENGLRPIEEVDYGIYAGVPAGWQNYGDLSYGKQEEGSLFMDVYSVPGGEKGSLADGISRLKELYADYFIPEAYEIVGVTPMNISGEQGQVLEVRYNMGDGWSRQYRLLVQQNGYRYDFNFTAADDSPEAATMWSRVLKSLELDYEAVPAVFGSISYPKYLLDGNEEIKRLSKAYHYEITLPEIWDPLSDRFESGRVEYTLTGGSFEIISDGDTSLGKVTSRMKDYYTEVTSGSAESSAKALGMENITFAGVPAVSFKLHQENRGAGYTERHIVFESEGVVHTISVMLNDVNATETQLQSIERVLGSFKLVK